MRNMSFMLTTEQMRNRTKDVTRRCGWENLKPGEYLQAVEKGMGLKKGQKAKVIGVIRVTDVRFELLGAIAEPFYGRKEVAREGFPDMKPWDFVRMFIDSHKQCESKGAATMITRIEFEHVDDPHVAMMATTVEGVIDG